MNLLYRFAVPTLCLVASVLTAGSSVGSAATLSDRSTVSTISASTGSAADQQRVSTVSTQSVQSPSTKGTIAGATSQVSSTPATNFFGMNVNGLLYGTPWPMVQVGTLRLWDTLTLWGDLNPSSGRYSWYNLDKQISMARVNGSEILFTFGGTPKWAIPQNLSIQSISRSKGVVTVTTSAPHNLYYNPLYNASSQTSVVVSGVTNLTFNGTFVLTGTPSATTLTYAQTGVDGSSSGGKVSAACSGPYNPEGCAEAPASLAAWDQFVTSLINHVGPGVIKYWEIWNEPNLPYTWRGDPALLVKMAQDARRIIKAVDPKAVIVSPSPTIVLDSPQKCSTWDKRCASNWLNNWLAAGGKSAVDVIAIHAYPDGGNAPEQVIGGVNVIRSVMTQNGVGSLPIWDTESSWGTTSNMPYTSDQLAFMSRHLILEHSLQVARSFWYAYDSDDWGSMWNSNSGLNIIGQAYKQVGNWLNGTTVTTPCAQVKGDTTTWACTYKLKNGLPAQVIWNTYRPVTATVPTQYTKYQDLAGHTYSISKPGTVQISTSPILLITK